METIAKQPSYKVKATPKDGSEVYFIYKGREFDKQGAEAECNSCNYYWGYKIDFEVVQA